MSYESTPPPPPPPGGTGGYEGPGGYGGYGGPGGGEHPEGQKLLIISIVALICCAPVNIWVLIQANGILAAGGPYDLTKVSTARIIAIVSLVLWALGFVVNISTGTLGLLFGG